MTDHPTPWKYDDHSGGDAFLYDANGNKIHLAYEGGFRREDAERIVQAVNLLPILTEWVLGISETHKGCNCCQNLVVQTWRVMTGNNHPPSETITGLTDRLQESTTEELVDALEDLAKLWAQEHERRLTVSKMLEHMKEQGE